MSQPLPAFHSAADPAFTSAFSARRQALRRLGVLASALTTAAGLTACGFELRRPPVLPFNRIALVGLDAASPLAQDLRRQLQQQVQVVDNPGQAELVLQALLDRRERSVVASTAVGQVRELQLRLRFEFRLATPGGRELAPPTELLLSRDMSYSETFALAKAQEEAEFYAAMQADVVQQVLRRLSRVTLGASAGAAAAPGAASAASGAAG